MSNLIKFLSGTLIITFLYSCGGGRNSSSDSTSVRQNPDGSISLSIESSDYYSDMDDPSANTAEWNVLVSKSGRYQIWLSSATTDTTDLNYSKPVLVSVQHNRVEGLPECDRIIKDCKDVELPWFRADSFLGSMYLQDTGLYHIQVISEKIVPKNYKAEPIPGKDLSKLLSVSLVPVTN